MPAKPRSLKVIVKFTANFEANLDAIEAFLLDCEAPREYDRLLDELGTTVVPTLERFPAIGRPFLPRQAHSVEALQRMERLEQLIGTGELREYLTSDYVILYALIDRTVYLLSIKHHKQLSFDFTRLWLG